MHPPSPGEASSRAASGEASGGASGAPSGRAPSAPPRHGSPRRWSRPSRRRAADCRRPHPSPDDPPASLKPDTGIVPRTAAGAGSGRSYAKLPPVRSRPEPPPEEEPRVEVRPEEPRAGRALIGLRGQRLGIEAARADERRGPGSRRRSTAVDGIGQPLIDPLQRTAFRAGSTRVARRPLPRGAGGETRTCVSHGRSGFGASPARLSRGARDARRGGRGARRVQEEGGRRRRRCGVAAGPGRGRGDRRDRRPRRRGRWRRGRPDSARARAHHAGDERARVGAARPVDGERRAQGRHAARLSAQGRHGRGQAAAREEVELPRRLVRAAPSAGQPAGDHGRVRVREGRDARSR